MAILKGINDAFYKQQFNPQTILNLLSKIEQSNWGTGEKKIAAALKVKLLHLMVGTEAPEVHMQDLNGTSAKLSSFKDKFVYLHFTTVTNPICRKQMDELKTIADQYKTKVEFINLLPKADLAKKELILQQNWPGKFMIVDDEVLENYQVKSFPTSYLLDEKGILISSPALNPLDGLSHTLSDTMKQKQLQ